MNRKKKAPGKAVSQGGKGHELFRERLDASAVLASGVYMSEARCLCPCKRPNASRPAESSRKTPWGRPIQLDRILHLSRMLTGLRPCRQMKHP